MGFGCKDPSTDVRLDGYITLVSVPGLAKTIKVQLRELNPGLSVLETYKVQDTVGVFGIRGNGVIN